MKTVILFGLIEAAGQPALCVALTFAVLLSIGAGVFIFRRRRKFFGRDPEVPDDSLVVRHNRAEEIILVWGGLTLVLLSILYQVWFN